MAKIKIISLKGSKIIKQKIASIIFVVALSSLSLSLSLSTFAVEQSITKQSQSIPASSLTISIESGAITLEPNFAINNGFTSRTTNVTVETDNPTGASLFIEMDASTPNNDLIGTKNSANKIPAITGNNKQNLDINSWGFYANNILSGSPSTLWNAIPEYNSPRTIFDEATDPEGTAGTNSPGTVTYAFTYGVRVDHNLPPDTYKGTILYTAITNEVPVSPPPVISNPSPPQGTVFPAGTTEIEFDVWTDIPATCRWGYSDADYASLPFAFGTSSPQGGLNHSFLIYRDYPTPGFPTGLVTIYIRCNSGLNGGINQESFVLNYTVTPQTLIMQQITNANCPATRTMAIDARDNNTYWVRKSGNLCWMETNLAYKGGGNNTYGDAFTVVNNIGDIGGSWSNANRAIMPGTSSVGVLNSNSSNTGNCYGNNASLDATRTACYWEPVGSNPTTAPTPPSLSTTGGQGSTMFPNRQLGLFYNWCAAMGNQPNACQTTTTGGIDTSRNICPAGWRLPTAVSLTNSEFLSLQQSPNNIGNNIFSNFLFMRGNQFSSGSLPDPNNEWPSAHYWSSTSSAPDSAAAAISTPGATGWSFPSSNSSRSNGFSVRCVR